MYYTRYLCSMLLRLPVNLGQTLLIVLSVVKISTANSLHYDDREGKRDSDLPFIREVSK